MGVLFQTWNNQKQTSWNQNILKLNLKFILFYSLFFIFYLVFLFLIQQFLKSLLTFLTLFLSIFKFFNCFIFLIKNKMQKNIQFLIILFFVTQLLVEIKPQCKRILVVLKLVRWRASGCWVQLLLLWSAFFIHCVFFFAHYFNIFINSEFIFLY